MAEADVRATTAADGSAGMMIGVHGGYTLFPNILVGVAGYITVVDPEIMVLSQYRNARYLRMGYAGVEGTYHLSLPANMATNFRLLVGMGGMLHHSKNTFDGNSPSDLFMVIEPNVEYTMQIMPNVNVFAAVGHRKGLFAELQGLPIDPSTKTAINVVDGWNGEVGVQFIF
jgi:hypothetical protein